MGSLFFSCIIFLSLYHFASVFWLFSFLFFYYLLGLLAILFLTSLLSFACSLFIAWIHGYKVFLNTLNSHFFLVISFFAFLFFFFWCSHVWLSLVIFIFKNERWHLVQASPLLNWFPIAFLIGCSMEWKLWDGVVCTDGSLWNGRLSCKMKWWGDGCHVGFFQKRVWEKFTVGAS